MKKTYIIPTTDVIRIGAPQLMAGSGFGPGDMSDPSMAPEVENPMDLFPSVPGVMEQPGMPGAGLPTVPTFPFE